MADLLTHSLSYKKEDLAQNWVEPAFTPNDLTSLMEVLTDVKGTQTLHRMSRPTNITKANVKGFTSAGSMTLTNEDITVAPLKAEWEENGESIVDSWIESALAKGYKLDDVLEMNPNDFFIKLVMPYMADAIQQDKVRMTWFANPKAEVMSGTVPASNPTGTLNTNLKPYTGLWSHFLTDITATTIPSAQVVTVTNAATARVFAVTLSGTSAGDVTLTVNGTAYTQAYATSVAATITAWHTSHAATIAARHTDELKLTVADDLSAKLTFTATHKGASFSVAKTDAGTGGTLTTNTDTAATKQADIASGTADGYFQSLIEALPPAGYEARGDMVFLVTKSMYRNYFNELKVTSGLESAFTMLQNGKKTLSYEGIPVVEMADWDTQIATYYNSVYRHRAVLTLMKNLVWATDGSADDKDIQTWYNQDEESRRFRVKYRAQTAYKYEQYLAIAR